MTLGTPRQLPFCTRRSGLRQVRAESPGRGGCRQRGLRKEQHSANAVQAHVNLQTIGPAILPCTAPATTGRAGLKGPATTECSPGGYPHGASTLLDKVDLGERATVHTEFAPTFSSSRVLHVRLALPVSLHVEPHKGVMQISKDGGGLHRDDVLRAFTSFSWRSSSVFGLLPLSVQPIRSLFVADGMPANRVFEALAANTEDRARDILLIVERQ